MILCAMFSATLATEKATLQTNYGFLMVNLGYFEISGNYWAHTFQLALPRAHTSKKLLSVNLNKTKPKLKYSVLLKFLLSIKQTKSKLKLNTTLNAQ